MDHLWYDPLPHQLFFLLQVSLEIPLGGFGYPFHYGIEDHFSFVLNQFGSMLQCFLRHGAIDSKILIKVAWVDMCKSNDINDSYVQNNVPHILTALQASLREIIACLDKLN
ncbi:hypothetical protein Nepgr_028414 [Nepenthes gracilis]|uniref:Uncharacterized protein n=1 Tax=Nepenthes gracilis TaxID=150966 RepID=A0AAD3TD09_NEPGR|nr:hypothetical protein Nepgr_028414 [Nepenthes gracilis]